MKKHKFKDQIKHYPLWKIVQKCHVWDKQILCPQSYFSREQSWLPVNYFGRVAYFLNIIYRKFKENTLLIELPNNSNYASSNYREVAVYVLIYLLSLLSDLSVCRFQLSFHSITSLSWYLEVEKTQMYNYINGRFSHIYF